MVLHNAIVYS